MNFESLMTGENSAPSDFSARQQDNPFPHPGPLSNQGQQYQQTRSFQAAAASPSGGGSGGNTNGQTMSVPQQYRFQMQGGLPSVETHEHNNTSNNSNYTIAESGNGKSTNGNQNTNNTKMQNYNGDFFTSVETNNPTQNINEISRRQRSLSEASVGSFSMDGDGNDMDFNGSIDETTTTTSQNTAPALHQNQPNALSTANGSNNNAVEMHGVLNGKNDRFQGPENIRPAAGSTHQAEDTAPGTTRATSTNETERGNEQPHRNEQQQQQQQQGPNDQVIELLDDGAETDATTKKSSQKPQSAGVKRDRPSGRIVPGSSLHGYQNHSVQKAQSHHNHWGPPAPGTHVNSMMIQQQRHAVRSIQSKPQIFTLCQNHTPTWGDPLPPQKSQQKPGYHQKKRAFELSLLNLSEFTITGLPVSFDGTPSSCHGFRRIIKKLSQGHGTPVFERDNPKNKSGTPNGSSGYEQYSSHGDMANPDGGKWRIPLGAYQEFFAYLRSDKTCRVEGIPRHQLTIASLGKARLEKGFPSAQKVMSYGVPKGLAMTLAPFQRAGVDFVVDRNGRALIADDMGLGKTIQSIASMSIYHNEWPLLILTPSSARYHWAAEFKNWLGAESSVNQKSHSSETSNESTNPWEKPESSEEDVEINLKPLEPMRLLKESEIHVMVAGKEKILPSKETRIVICSYGLATSLVDSGKLRPGLFRCAIVDESHYLKNMKTKRTSKLVPVLHATNRCILLSGTPALARPTELWPQLKILSTERDGWWDNEDEFVRKYVQRTSAIRRAELHTMLTGTVMIRRLKHDILKSLPKKQRERAVVDVLTPELREEFHTYMKLLREGKGVMAKIAKKHSAVAEKSQEEGENLEKATNPIEEKNRRLQALQAEYDEKCRQKLQSIRYAMQSVVMNPAEKENMVAAYFNSAKVEVDVWYKERVHQLEHAPTQKEEELDRKTILNKMYTATAKAKIPFIAELVGKWLDDPMKGKLCIFAHHIYVLDQIVDLVGLSNDKGSRRRFIRIDGSTNPKERQAQIVAFQNDPDIRIAVLGITAAGVAVTLTASSTVWFTELFWTPALMIQAEDRCHRIGQNSAVKCLYFVATGTLDVLLWDLLEKKFRDLGEFVEGKEKMKIVVQRTYKSVKEVHSIFDRTDDDDLEEDSNSNENEGEEEGDDLIKLENDLQDDIGQLAQEEMGMIKQDDDDDGAYSNNKIAQPIANAQPTESKSTLGQTEDEAICLSDDDDDDDDEAVVVNSNGTGNPPKPYDITDFNRVLTRPRFYKQWFKGSSYGIQLLKLGRRLTVIQNTFGQEKPAFGDILVGVNGHRVQIDAEMGPVCLFMRNALRNGTTELIFLEDEDFLKEYSPAMTLSVKEVQAQERMRMKNKKLKSAPPTNKDEPIEILDDDDD